MRVKAVKRYNDIVLKKVVEKETVMDVTEARGKHLIEQGMAEAIEEPAESKKTEKKETAK